jgi:large subunit ribosomal protein L21
MYAIVKIGGHQFGVSAGDIIDVQKLEQTSGDTITLDSVLFVGQDQAIVGSPLVKGATVKAKVIRQARSRKVIVFKRKPGQYRKKNGHRQPYTSLLITEVNNGAGDVQTMPADHKNAKHLN